MQCRLPLFLVQNNSAMYANSYAGCSGELKEKGLSSRLGVGQNEMERGGWMQEVRCEERDNCAKA